MHSQGVAVSIAALVLASGAAAQCQPEWLRAIGTPGVQSTGYIEPMIVWNDGTGDKLYVGGSFRNLAGNNFIAAYDLGSGTWSDVGGGISASFVTAFETFNPGTGEKLIVGGANWTIPGVSGTQNLAMWDGQTWHATGANLASNIQSVWALHVWDDGTGPKLFAGGGFDEIGGMPAARIASWDGTTWQTLGAGITTGSTVFALANYDDGSGDALYVGGRFTGVDHQFITNIARWDGSTWSQVGQGLQVLSATQQIGSLRVMDLGYGDELFASGAAFMVEGAVTANAARWNGQSWTALGQQLTGTVRHMVVLDEGDGPRLYAGAAGATGGGMYGYFMRLDEATNTWESTGAHFDATVFGVYRHADHLYLGGSFREISDGTVGSPHPVGGIVARTICPADPPCYADCDGNEALNIDDFICFINEFATAQALPTAQQITHYANCDGSTNIPVLTIDDFICFINEFAQGCP